jgi:hypothetical protein
MQSIPAVTHPKQTRTTINGSVRNMRASFLLLVACTALVSATPLTFTDGEPIDPNTGKGAPILGTLFFLFAQAHSRSRLTLCSSASPGYLISIRWHKSSARPPESRRPRSSICRRRHSSQPKMVLFALQDQDISWWLDPYTGYQRYAAVDRYRECSAAPEKRGAERVALA